MDGGGGDGGMAEQHLQLFKEGSLVEVSSDEEGFKGVWFIATVLEPPSHSGSKRKTQNQNKFYVEYKTLTADEEGSGPLREHVNVDFVRPLPPVKTDFRVSFGLNDVVDAYYQDGWWTGVITRVLEDSRFVVNFQNPPDVIEFGVSELRVHHEWIDGQWVRPEKQQSEQQKVGEQDNQTTGPGEVKEGRAESQVKNPQPTAGESNGVENAAEDFVENQCITKEYELSSITGLELKGLSGSRIEKPHEFLNEESLKHMRDQKQEMDGPTLYKIMKGDQLVGGESNQKRKRGRPPKSLVNSPKASATGVGSTTEGLLRSEKCIKLIGDDKKPTYGSPEQEKENSSVAKRVLQTSSKKQKKHPPKRGRRKTTSLMTESRIPDAYGGKTVETDYIMEEVETIDSDDQPLLAWFEGIQSPTTADFSSRSMQQCTEARDGHKKTVLQSSEAEGQGDTLPSENRRLPFLKDTTLWQAIETMEVFQKMPQKPHFHPLKCYRKSAREGVAIGCMVNFSSVVKKTSRLRFDEPRSTIEDSMETLDELKTYGFDVQVVRDRLTELLSIKDKREVLQEQIKEVNSQMVEHTYAKIKIDGEIDEIEKQMKELQEKRAVVMSMKDIKESEIASFQSKLDDINEGIRTSRSDFEGLAAAPW